MSRPFPFFRKALEFGEREFGSNHSTTATFLNNLARLYHAQGRYADAEPLHERSLAIWEKALGQPMVSHVGRHYGRFTVIDGGQS